ncbi:MAG: hypothetical protein PHT19_05665 [Methylococcus sp.]|nr:hypothetical protein [Methylococcus sp.]
MNINKAHWSAAAGGLAILLSTFGATAQAADSSGATNSVKSKWKKVGTPSEISAAPGFIPGTDDTGATGTDTRVLAVRAAEPLDSPSQSINNNQGAAKGDSSNTVTTPKQQTGDNAGDTSNVNPPGSSATGGQEGGMGNF